MLTKLPPLRGWSKAPDPDYENRLLYWIETDVGEYQLKPRRTIKGNKKVYSAWRGSVFISNHNTAAQAAKAAAEDFKFTWSTKGYNSEANPGIRAQVRRLPSGQIQLKIPLGRQNPQEVVRGLKRVLGRRVKAAQMIGGTCAYNPGILSSLSDKEITQAISKSKTSGERLAWLDAWRKALTQGRKGPRAKKLKSVFLSALRK